MAEGLKLKIGADVSQGVAAINQFNKAVTSIKPGAQQAQLAMVNLGRVAQDLPFGFLGIANNLNPLLESFQRLRAESGSTGGALKALASSLIGGGGVGLALSAVTALLTFSQIGFQAWSRGAKEAKESNDEFKKSIKENAQIQGDAIAGVQGQIAQVQALARVIANTNKPYEERKRALQELRETNKSYFGDLTLEASKLGIVAQRVKEYTEALVQQAIVKKFSDAIADTAKAVSDQERAVDKARQSLINFRKAEADALQKINAQAAPSGTADEGAALALSTAQAFQKAAKQRIDAEKKLAEENEKLTLLGEQRIHQTNDLNKAVESGLKLRDLEVEAVKKVKTVEEQVRHARVLDLKDLKEQQKILDTINGKGTAKKAAVEPTGPITPSIGLPGSDKESEDARKRKEQFDKLQEAIKITDVLVKTLGDSFTGLFDDILSGGKNAFQAFGQAIAQVIRKLVSAAITAALFAAIVSAATGGAGGGFLGNFKSIFQTISGLPKFAKGGVVTGPTAAIVGDNPSGKEAIIPFERMGAFLDKFGGNGYIATAELGFDKILIGIRRQERREGNLT